MLEKRPSVVVVVVTLLAVLLPVIATLQYRWLGQVSDSERERLQSSLKSSVDNFSRDFDREIIRTYLDFQVESTSDKECYEAIARSYERWRGSSAYPNLITDVFHVSVSDGSAELSKFDPAAKRMESIEWPDEFAPIREELSSKRQPRVLRAFEANVDSITLGTKGTDHTFQHGHSSADILLQGPTNPIEPDIPALIIPVASLKLNTLRLPSDLTQSSSYTIVRLNSDYIKNEILPALARKYFAGSNGFNYNVSVVRHDSPHEVVFATDPNISLPNNGRADATVGIFGVKIDQIEEFLRGELWQRPIDGTLSNRSARVMIRSLKDSSTNSAGGPVALYESTHAGFWDAIVQHRAGSLEAAVTGTRRRNLILSFSVLLLLAVSVALIAVSSRRAMRLARQQMEFVASVSHELRTPLAVIRSAGENLADGVVEDKAQIREYGDLIQNEGRRLTAMVEQVLEFAGAQSGHKAFELHPVHIGEIINSAVESCRPEIEERGFGVETEIDRDLPMVMADRDAVSRSIQNLISNAIKYSGISRRIVVEAERTLDERGDCMVAVIVRDDGIGLASSEIAHVFEPFYRGKQALAEQIHGSGLGLSIVKHIVESHGGRVTVDSAPGKGSAFKFTLKAVSDAAVV